MSMTEIRKTKVERLAEWIRLQRRLRDVVTDGGRDPDTQETRRLCEEIELIDPRRSEAMFIDCEDAVSARCAASGIVISVQEGPYLVRDFYIKFTPEMIDRLREVFGGGPFGWQKHVASFLPSPSEEDSDRELECADEFDDGVRLTREQAIDRREGVRVSLMYWEEFSGPSRESTCTGGAGHETVPAAEAALMESATEFMFDPMIGHYFEYFEE